MSIFGKSPLEKRIDALTDENLPECGDVGGSLHLADTLNSALDEGRDIVKYLNKRLKAKSSMGRVQHHALTLLDVLMKNGGPGFHTVVARGDTLKLVTEIGTDQRMPNSVRDLALQLLESWGEAFSKPVVLPSGQVLTLPEFSKQYYTLRAKGVEFPPRDMTSMAPVVTPNRNTGVVQGVNVLAQQQQQQRFGSQGQASPYGAPLPVAPAAVVPRQQQQPYGAPQPNPQQQLQPPQQQQQQQRARSASQAAAAAAALSPQQRREFEQCTVLSVAFIDKLKRETRLTHDWLLLLRDLCSAADSPSALSSDALVKTLSDALREVRTRYTKLVLEVGDLALSAPQHAPAVEYVLDVAIRMIEQCRVMIDYHKACCSGVKGLSPPEIALHRSLQPDRRPSPSPAAVAPVSSPAANGSVQASPGGSVPGAQQQLFDLGQLASSSSNGEDEEKRAAASALLQPAREPAHKHVSPDGFTPAQSFAPASHWAPSSEQPSHSDPAAAEEQKQSPMPGASPPASASEPTPFDDASSVPSSLPLARTRSEEEEQASRASAAAHAFDLLAPMRVSDAQQQSVDQDSVLRPADAPAQQEQPSAFAFLSTPHPSAAAPGEGEDSVADNPGGDGGDGPGGDEATSAGLPPGGAWFAPSGGSSGGGGGGGSGAAAAASHVSTLPSDDDFFADMAALTIPQGKQAEGKEGEL